MTQEEKSMLLKDLCARLPYLENWVQFEGKDYIITGYGHGRVSLLPSPFSSAVGPCPLIEEVKPYLRPMSSMTEEEVKEIQKINWQFGKSKSGECYVGDADDGYCSVSQMVDILGYLNEHHFDYRGLIEKGLALEAPEGMYKTE